MSRFDRDAILAKLQAEDVCDHLGISGQWRGRWMHSFRCPVTDHSSAAFAVSEDGKIHCFSCDYGGDLLLAIALGEGLDIKVDFPKVLEIAAGIAGVDPEGDDSFGLSTKPKRVERLPPPPIKPLADRVKVARKRAAWVWARLFLDKESAIPSGYLRKRGLDPKLILARDDVRSTPLRLEPALREAIRNEDKGISAELVTLWHTMGATSETMSIVVPVRHVVDGALVDLRARRVEPREGRAKIIGMVGGVTSSPAERGRPRQLVGCYGNPHDIDSDLVVVVEGAMDYLTALQLYPNAQVLGAVEAGTTSLVVRHAALCLRARDDHSRLLIVEQDDPPRNTKQGKVIPGAADQAINEQPVAAAKSAFGILGPRRVGHLFCSPDHCAAAGGWRTPVKDLNDVMLAGADVRAMEVWWPDPPSES